MHLISRLMLTGVAVAFLPPFLGIGAQTLEPRSSTSPQHLQDDAGPEITPGNRCHRFVRNPATGKWCPNGFGILHEVGIKNGDLQIHLYPKDPGSCFDSNSTADAHSWCMQTFEYQENYQKMTVIPYGSLCENRTGMAFHRISELTSESAPIAFLISYSLQKIAHDLDNSCDNDWAWCKNFDNEPDLGLKACTKVIQDGHYSSDKLITAFRHRGNGFIKEGDVAAAIQDFDEAIKRDPSKAEDFYARGFAHRVNGALDVAARDIDQAIKLSPNYLPAVFERGVIYSDNDEYDRAIEQFEKAVKLSPSFNGLLIHTILAQRGNAYQKKGEFERAMQDFDAAIRRAPKEAYLFGARAAALAEKKEYDRAIQDYDHAIILDPKFEGAFINRGGVYFKKGDYDRAIQDYDKAIGLGPNFVNAFYFRADAYAAKHEYERAIKDYDEAIKRNPGQSWFLAHRAFAYRRLGNFRSALADYDEAIRSNPDNAVALYGRGIVKQLAGDAMGGEADIAAAKQIDPDVSEPNPGERRP